MNYRSGRHTQKDNQMIIMIDGVDSKEKAEKLVGKSVTFKTDGGKEIKGKVTGPHGSKGVIKAIFERGMPGQSLAKTVELN